MLCLLYIRGSKGFDGLFEVGEASRTVMRQMPKLKLNAEDNLAVAAYAVTKAALDGSRST